MSESYRLGDLDNWDIINFDIPPDPYPVVFKTGTVRKQSVMKPIIDARGHTIKEGTRVAFNYSGTVAIGTVEKYNGGKVYINRETHPSVNMMSQVRPENILAIFEEADIEKAARDMRNDALSDYAKANKEFLRMIRDAWDLDDIHIRCEEMYGKDWKDDLD